MSSPKQDPWPWDRTEGGITGDGQQGPFSPQTDVTPSPAGGDAVKSQCDHNVIDTRAGFPAPRGNVPVNQDENTEPFFMKM